MKSEIENQSPKFARLKNNNSYSTRIAKLERENIPLIECINVG